MLRNNNSTDALQAVDLGVVVQIIDSGTITQETTGNFSPGPTGPVTTLDSGTITEVTTDDFSTTPPTTTHVPDGLFRGGLW